MLNIFYNESVSDNEMNFEMTYESAALKVDRAIAAYGAVCEMAALDLREAELKCVQEAGDLDHLASLYMEAEEKNAEKKEGILKKIWSGIKSLFANIKNFFFGDNAKKIGNGDSAQIDKNDEGFFKTTLKKILDFIKKIPSFIAGHKVAAAIAALTAIGGGAFVVTAIKKMKSGESGESADVPKAKEDKKSGIMVTIKGSVAQIFKKNAEEALTAGESVASDLASDARSEEDPGKAGFLNGIAIALKGFAAWIRSKLSALVNAFNGKSKKEDSDGGQKAIEEKKRPALPDKSAEAAATESALSDVDGDFVIESTLEDDYDEHWGYAEESSLFDDIDYLLDEI